MDDNARLRRVEDKIDDLQKAIIALAKVEVKIETIFSRQTSIEEKVIRPTIDFLKESFGLLYVRR